MMGLRTLIFDVGDLRAAKAFYAQVLAKAPYFDQPFYVGFDVDGYELGLRPAEGAMQPGSGGATGYLGVHDVAAEVERLVALGASVREAPSEVGEGIVTATITDPFGNQLGLIHNPQFAPTLVRAGSDDLSPQNIVLEQVVPQKPADVWKLWSSSEGLCSWLVDSAKVDLRPGGAYEIYFMMDVPAGSRGSEDCRVLSFVEGRMLSFTWNAPPHLDRVRHDHTWVVVELEAEGSDATRVRVTHTGWPVSGLAEEPQWQLTFDYFQNAWKNVLDELDHFTRSGSRRPT